MFPRAHEVVDDQASLKILQVVGELIQRLKAKEFYGTYTLEQAIATIVASDIRYRCRLHDQVHQAPLFWLLKSKLGESWIQEIPELARLKKVSEDDLAHFVYSMKKAYQELPKDQAPAEPEPE